MDDDQPQPGEDDDLVPEQAQTLWYGFQEDVEDADLGEELPVLPLRGVAVLPSAIVPLLISRPASLAVVETALEGNRMIALMAQLSAETEQPGPEALFDFGTAARILKMLKYPDGNVRILVQGVRRIRTLAYIDSAPCHRARIEVLNETPGDERSVQALKTQIIQNFSRYIEMAPHLPSELQVIAVNIKQPGRVCDLIASNLNLPLEELQRTLETLDIEDRLQGIGQILSREIELLELGQKIQGEVQTELKQNQKEFYLRQQLRAIQRELGEDEERSSDIEALRDRIEAAGLPEEAAMTAANELKRLAMIPPESAEYSVVRTYIEWLADIPWSVETGDNLDIQHARSVLDEDHFDLEKIKERILEFLAVRQLRASPRGPILCFVGPPGVGKTSLGKSIARALGRNFQRLSLGGVRDEAEIRGHRRTYVGSLPGRIVQALKTSGSSNPLFMLDEIDKLGADFRGDPASALLEVLDPEQNFSFRDHYLEVPVDLSKVLFLTTANYLDPIPPALRDRMEVLELSGYSEEEKLEIAKRHLIPKQIEENGLSPGFVVFDDAALRAIARDFTKEAGLRNFEREIGAICRKVARRVTEGLEKPMQIDCAAVTEFLGAPRFVSELADRQHGPGVAVGLAWTAAGGDILFIEASRMHGKKQLTLTGQLGDIMKESAQAALTFLRSNAAAYGIEPKFFEDSDIHIHVPAGAIPKDGPSAGVAIATALASTLTGRPVRRGTAMTGEITLRGAVLPVGGIKEKILGARRAGICEVYLPAANQKDVAEIAPELLEGLRFHYIHEVAELIPAALAEAPVGVDDPAGDDPTTRAENGTVVAV